MAASAAHESIVDVEAFITEYYGAWQGTDEDRIMSYYADNVTVHIPGTLMQGNSAVREQFVRPFVTAFPGNRHVVKNMVFGRDVVVVEFSFNAEHTGPFAGRSATNAHIEVLGCGVYEYDLAKRQITTAHIYFDVGALLKQILDHSGRHSSIEEAAAARIGTPVEHLDLATAIAVSQAVSGEMVLEKLLDTLMRTAIEHAGAERALLIRSREAGQRIAAEATTSHDTVMVQLCDEAVTGSLLPETILRHVQHTREGVILDDAATPNPFSADPYLAARHARSVFCLPLMNQAAFIGVLYLEHTRAPRVFAPARSAVLKLLASQAAVSLENSRYLTERKRAEQALCEREREAGLILDTIPGLVAMLTPAGEVDFVNHELVEYCGQPLEAMKAWGTNGTVHSEDLPRIVPLFMQAIGSGQPYEFEARIRRFDGGYHWCRIRGLPLRDANGGIVRWYTLLSDIDDRKRAEDAIDKARSELAHVARVTALGALTASIAHEVNQPLSGIITNAGTCLRMLDKTPPDIDGARETARRTIRDGNRAADVITRLRALFGKREFALESLDLNDAVREVIALSANDLQRDRIVLQAELADDLPVVTGDRIQLQQVILNLLRNAAEAMADVDLRPRDLLIRTEREDGERVRVTIRDAGVGLAPRSLDALFDAFHTTKSGGMGIGLFVCRSIIERHHGRLWAEPNRGAPGATFSFSIPRGGDEGPAAGP